MGFVIGQARERRHDGFELGEIALQRSKLRTTPFQHALDDEAQQIFGVLHHIIEIRVRDLRLEHPELRQVTARLALFGAEGRAKAVDLAERHGRGFCVQLARLCQIRFLFIEVVHFEKRAGAFACSRREDGRVDADEALLFIEVANRLRHAIADAQDRPLTTAAQPKMAVRQEEVGAVLLGRDREALDLLHDLAAYNRDLHATRRTFIGLDHAVQDEAGLLAQAAHLIKELGTHIPLEHDGLHIARAVTQLEEVQLALRALVGQPAAQGDCGAYVLLEFLDGCDGMHER